MTRQEAIKILWQYDVNFEPHPAEDVMHAIDMAIEALEQEPSEDCISRQDAINVLLETIAPPSLTLDTLVMRIDAIPSADRPTGRWHIEPGIGCFCSKCSFDIGNDLEFMEYVRFCPYCGARMESEEE